MKDGLYDPAFDVGVHVVEINKLVNELNRVTRQTFKPDYEAIDNISTEIKHHALMLQRICDWTGDL